MFFKRFVCVAMLGLLLAIPTRLTLAYLQAPQPQAILMLGGDPNREVFTAQFAQDYPDLPIWISSGISDIRAHIVFRNANISAHRLHLDRRATDTVTNFTTLVGDLNTAGVRHLYLITSDYHMARARAIASLWQADDRATAQMTQDFYRFLQAPDLNKAQALQQAQIQAIRSGSTILPAIWAPLVLVGN